MSAVVVIGKETPTLGTANSLAEMKSECVENPVYSIQHEESESDGFVGR